MRNIFPESAFTDGDVDGVPYRRLDGSNSSVEEAQRFAQYLEEGVLNSTTLNNLSHLDLLICTSPHGPVVESYTFNLQKNDKDLKKKKKKNVADENGDNDNDDDDDGTKFRSVFVCRSLQLMLRKLLVTTQALGPLPEGAMIAMRLVWTPQTAAEYEPRWFQSGGHAMQLQQDVIDMDLNLGKVEAKQRCVELTFRALPEQIRETYSGDDDDDNGEQHNDQDGIIMSSKRARQ